ncbi:hypothetical protein BH10BAC2_BH10BAC2_39990 [soil metagenome]
MENSPEIFELDYKNGRIRVQEHFVANQVIFRIAFSDKRPTLIITRALTNNAAHFWTSIPEGRQIEADEIGPLIAVYIKSNQS